MWANVWQVPLSASVTTTDQMFSKCVVYTGQGIGAWDTSSCRRMSHMFSDCHSLDSDISAWDTSSVEIMTAMFLRAILRPIRPVIGSDKCHRVPPERLLTGQALASLNGVHIVVVCSVTLRAPRLSCPMVSR